MEKTNPYKRANNFHVAILTSKKDEKKNIYFSLLLRKASVS